jgi:hypothetical protein
MTKRVNSHPSNRRSDWKEPGKSSFAEFNLLVRQQVTEIIQSQEHVQRAYDLFRSRGDIGSDECDYLFASLRTINISLSTFYKTFEEPMNLPSVVRLLYYPLVAELLASEKLIKRTTQIARGFSSPSRVASNAVVKQHYTIIRSLEELLEACEAIRLYTQNMLDQARFQMLRQI